LISLQLGDITTLDVDTIVNPANKGLLGGGGVDGAIHEAAGPELLVACRLLKGCATGDAKITRGFKLPVRWVIHTVAPIWRGGEQGEAKLLQTCYEKSFELALTNNTKSIAFPAIGTGIYHHPKAEAAKIAINVMLKYESKFDRIIACCHSQEDLSLYQSTYKEAANK
jgi:O-acetyl-ADP-ribose deacetylase (regulator of RNase III)